MDPKWKGKTMLARFAEEVPAHLAFLWGEKGKLNRERSFDFFTKLEKLKPLIASGFRGGIQRVAAGGVPIFWFAVKGPAFFMADIGAPVGLVAFPKFAGSFRGYGILNGSLHSAAAWLFIDYLSSPEGQGEYTDVISAKVPFNKKAKTGKLAKWLIEQKATVGNTVPLDAEIVFNKDVTKKSETFFFKLLEIK